MFLDKTILGGCREEVLLIVEAVVVLISDDMGEEVKVGDGCGGDQGTGDDVVGRGRWGEDEGLGLSRNEDRGEEGGVIKNRGRQTGDGNDGRGGLKCVGTWAGEIPGVEVTVKDLKDSGSGVGEVLLIDVVNGRPGGDRDLGKGGGSDDGRLGQSERHFKQSALLWRLF